MDAIDKVSAEIEKVITKFSAINHHSCNLLKNEIIQMQIMRESLCERKLYNL